MVMAKRVATWVGFAILTVAHSCLPTLSMSGSLHEWDRCSNLLPIISGELNLGVNDSNI